MTAIIRLYRILAGGVLNGAILENYTVAEIRKTWYNSARECMLHYYRDKDTNEIDMVIETDGELHPLEIKKSSNPGSEPADKDKRENLQRGADRLLIDIVLNEKCMRQSKAGGDPPALRLLTID